MTTTAVLVMVVALVVVWGGLGLSIWRLRRDTRHDDDAGPEQAGSSGVGTSASPAAPPSVPAPPSTPPPSGGAPQP